MENRLTQIADNIPTLIKNTHLNISLDGWPAAITAIALFGSSVVIYALKVTHPDTAATSADTYDVAKAA